MTYRFAIIVSRQNVNARSKNGNRDAPIAEVRDRIVDVGGTSSASSGGRSRRVFAGIIILVSSSNNDEDTGLGGLGHRPLDSLPFAVGSTQAHVDDDAIGAITLLGVRDSVQDGGHDVGKVTAAILIADLHGEELGLLGNTIGLGSNRTSDVSSVAKKVIIGAVDLVVVLDEGGAAFKVRVIDPDTCVDDVGTGTLTGRRVISIIGLALVVMADASQAPGGVHLLCEHGALSCVVVDMLSMQNNVRFNIGDLL
jgi:hypothetical protein